MAINKVTENLSGADATKSGSSGKVDWKSAPENLYPCNVEDVTLNDKGNYTFATKVNEKSEYVGMSLSATIGADDRDGNKNARLAALLSVGVDQAEATRPGYTWDHTTFVGKEITIYYKQKTGNEEYNTQKIVSPTQAAAIQKAIAAKAANIANAKPSSVNGPHSSAAKLPKQGDKPLEEI